MLLTLCESRANLNCRAGLTATNTTPANMAMMPITTKTSINVNPFSFVARLIFMVLIIGSLNNNP